MVGLVPGEMDVLESMVDGTYSASDSVGDPMEDSPNNGTTRLFIQNLNGLLWNNDGGKWPYVCETIATTQADIACFSELNTDTNRYDVRKIMEDTCKRQFNQHRLVLASSTTKSATTYKPGGTAILARDSVTIRIKSQTRDRMGRWTSISFTTSPTRRLRVISAYQVGKQVRPGTNTAAAQQTAQLILEHTNSNIHHRQNPRQAFRHDLSMFIKQVQTDNEDIILVGDFNDDITSPDSNMQHIATQCGLVDLFSIRLGSPNIPSTYQRGNKRLDYVLVSPSLVPMVTAAGYDPFGYRLPSDHRAMYIDLSTDLLFDHDFPDIVGKPQREFSTSTPGVVKTYVTAKIKYLNDHRFFERLQDLESNTNPNHDLAERLDRDFQRASLHAARMCTRKQRPPWSPQLAQAWAELHYYRILSSATKTAADYQPAIQRLQRLWPQLPVAQNIASDTLVQLQKAALAKLKQIRQDAQKLREDFLLQKHALSLANDDATTAKVLARIIRAESQHQVYTKIKTLRRHEEESSSLTSLKIPKYISPFDTDAIKLLPDDDHHWETITVPEDIERLLLQRNQKHFAQAEGTPLTQPPFTADIGYKADGYAADLLLTGNLEYKNVPEATALVIKHLQQRTTTTLEGSISKADVLGKLRRWNEATTTSPSGIHLGHYHCTWRDPKMQHDDPTRDTILKYQQQLLDVTVHLLNYALRFGYTFERWTKVVNIMLQKDAGNPRIHRLRIIHIYEADYNLLLAVKWRQALFHAEDHKLLNSGMYGSRPGKSAHDPAFMEVLQHETYRMSMKSGINFDLDAASCYDRILPNMAVISSRRMGMASTVTNVNALTLQSAKYHLKTQLGTSTTYYQHSPQSPIYGTGQGSGNSPTIWCFVCSLLFDAFQSKAHGASFRDYYKSIILPLYMTGFVDDCAQRVNQFDADPQPSDTTLMTIMEKDAQLWNDLLWTSGGQLEPTKCSFHLIQSDWTSTGQPFLKGGIQRFPIYIQHNGQPLPAKQKSNYDAHKSLGCYISPAYTRTQPWKALTNKNETFAQLLESNFFSRSEAWTFYTSIYLPSITYPMVITPLDKSQCQQLDARFLRSLLPRCGYNRNIPRSVRYGPVSMGGAGFKDLYVVQGSLLLQQVQKYLNSPSTPIGQLLRITISWTQAFLGTSRFFLRHPHHPIPPAGPSLLLDLRQFLQMIDGAIDLIDPPIPVLLRQNDRNIMDIILGQTMWKPKHIMQLNACRRALQAQTLADITNLAGTRIQSFAITGSVLEAAETVRVSTFNQKSPATRAWRTWRRFLATISNQYGVLCQPLNKWTKNVTHLRHWPSYLYDPATDTLLSHRKADQYTIHTRISSGCFSIHPSNTTVTGIGYPTAVHMTMGTLRSCHNYIHDRPLPDAIIPIGLKSPIKVQTWEHLLLGHVQHLCSDIQIREKISSCNILTCSDGSVRSPSSSFGFIISDTQGTRLITGSGPAPGNPPTSFRSEAYGVLALVRWLHHAFLQFPPPPQATITHYMDNKGVIQRIQHSLTTTWSAPNHRMLPEQDVVDAIVSTLRTLPIRMEFEWVKGHQDSILPYHQLPLPAQLNCDADHAAAQWYDLPPQPESTIIPHLPMTPSHILLHGHPITRYFKSRTYAAATLLPLHNYVKEKFQWSDATDQDIDWIMYKQIITKYRNSWTTLVKHLHAICPTGKIAHRNNPHLPHECPTCNTPQETNNHLLVCSHGNRSQWQKDTIRKATQYASASVDPYLLDILRDGLLRFHRQIDLIPQSHYPARYASLIHSQNNIGWDQLYRGRWSLEWRSHQDAFMVNNPQRCQLSGNDWIRGIGRLLIDQWLHLWKLRNEDRHGNDQAYHSILRERTIHAELRELYAYRLRVCPVDRHLFHTSAEEHIQRHPSLDSLEDWIHTYRPVILSSVEQARLLGITHNLGIHEYPTANPASPASEQASLTAGLPAG